MKTETPTNPDEQGGAPNPRNGQPSTGPKTEAGKQVSAQNALKFGFFSTKALLPGESAEEFAEISRCSPATVGPT